MDALFVPLSEATGASLDQVKLISCLLVSYPLGSVFIRIPNDKPNLKHLFNVTVTLFYLLAVLNLWFGFFQLLLDVLGTYYIASANLGGRRMPWLVFAFIMGHLTINHIIRVIYNLGYETFEITGPQMVLTMKLTTFAWNVYDGRRPEEELDKWQKEKRVIQYPSLLTFLGYAFYFPGVLVGPSLEFAEYINLIDGALFKSLEKIVEEKRASATIPGRLVPRGRKRVAYRKMVMGLIYLGLFVYLGGEYNYSIALKDWFAERSLFYRISIYQFCGFFERAKYYAIWTLTEGASILTGLGFTGVGPRGETRWEGAANIDVWNIEFAPNVKILLDSWNMKTNVWLRECIYKRVTPKGKKPGFMSTMLTFLTSAFWHGIAGGYYIAFLLGGFAQTVARLCRSNLRPLFLPPTWVEMRGGPAPPQTPLKRAYDVAGIVSCFMVLNFMAAPFIILSVQDSLLAWRRLGWYGLWMIFGTLAFFQAGGARWLKRVQARRVAKVPGEAKKLANVSGSTTPSAQTVLPLDQLVQEMGQTEFVRKLNG